MDETKITPQFKNYQKIIIAGMIALSFLFHLVLLYIPYRMNFLSVAYLIYGAISWVIVVAYMLCIILIKSKYKIILMTIISILLIVGVYLFEESFSMYIYLVMIPTLILLLMMFLVYNALVKRSFNDMMLAMVIYIIWIQFIIMAIYWIAGFTGFLDFSQMFADPISFLYILVDFLIIFFGLKALYMKNQIMLGVIFVITLVYNLWFLYPLINVINIVLSAVFIPILGTYVLAFMSTSYAINHQLPIGAQFKEKTLKKNIIKIPNDEDIQIQNDEAIQIQNDAHKMITSKNKNEIVEVNTNQQMGIKILSLYGILIMFFMLFTYQSLSGTYISFDKIIKDSLVEFLPGLQEFSLSFGLSILPIANQIVHGLFLVLFVITGIFLVIKPKLGRILFGVSLLFLSLLTFLLFFFPYLILTKFSIFDMPMDYVFVLQIMGPMPYTILLLNLLGFFILFKIPNNLFKKYIDPFKVFLGSGHLGFTQNKIEPKNPELNENINKKAEEKRVEIKEEVIIKQSEALKQKVEIKTIDVAHVEKVEPSKNQKSFNESKEQLKQLNELLQIGIINQNDYDRLKSNILEKLEVFVSKENIL